MERRTISGDSTAFAVVGLLAFAFAVVVGTAGAATTAANGFPGRNGLIGFNAQGQVLLVSPNGNGLTELAQTNTNDVTTGVSFSRDGKLVAYSAYKGTDPDIYVIPVSGGRTPGSGGTWPRHRTKRCSHVR